MKVLQLGKFYPIRGGVEKVMYDLTKGLSERGIYCDMLCASQKSEVINLNERGRVVCVKALMKLAATMISPTMILRLRQCCNEYDIIHVHHPDPMACLALFCSGYKGKVVLHWHSDILKQKFLLTFYAPLQNWLVKRADKIVGTTPIYVQQSPALKYVQSKTTYLPIGIEPMQPLQKKVEEIRGRYKDKKLVYSLGRLVEYKGFEYLIEAAKYLGDNYMILIGGNGPLKEKLQKQIDEQQLNNKVKLLGYLTDEDSAGYYGACNVYCLSSVFKTEAYAIVQLEAMSCGKPVVATQISGSGVSWVNHDGYSGLNVQPKDPKALAGAIVKLTASEDFNRKVGKQARQLFDDLYGFDKMIDRCISIYDSL